MRTLLTKISPEYSLEELMQTLKLQYFAHLMQRTELLETPLMLGRTKGGRRKETTEKKWLDSSIDSNGMSMSKLREWVIDRAS